MDDKTIDSELQAEANKKGYVRAEDVIGVRNPQYNEDNINFETERDPACYGLFRDYRLGEQILRNCQRSSIR